MKISAQMNRTVTGVIKRLLYAAASIPIVLGSSGVERAHADSILFNQIATPTSALGGYASQQSPNTNYLAADNFTLHTGAFITGVQWQGSFSSQPPSAITQFVVTFWSNSNGLPGSILQTFTFPGNAGQTFVQSDQAGFLLYDYAVLLPNPFTAHNGVTYWISIRPTTDFPAQPQWYWREGGSASGYSTNSGSGGLTFMRGRGDDSFSLTGTTFNEPPPPPVPEPPALLLFSTGLMTASGYRWLVSGGIQV